MPHRAASEGSMGQSVSYYTCEGRALVLDVDKVLSKGWSHPAPRRRHPPRPAARGGSVGVWTEGKTGLI